MHVEQWPFNCHLCLKYFKTRNELDDHKREEGHTGEVRGIRKKIAYKPRGSIKSTVPKQGSRSKKSLAVAQSKADIDEAQQSTGQSRKNLRREGKSAKFWDLESKFSN